MKLPQTLIVEPYHSPALYALITEASIVPAISSIDKLCVNTLQFDDFIWGSFADHFASEKKYREKAENVVKSGKPKHTVFCVNTNNKDHITYALQSANKTKGGWIDNPPPAHLNFRFPEHLDYWTCENTPSGITCEAGHGYPIARVKADIELLREAANDNKCSNSTFYSPHHLQDIENG